MKKLLIIIIILLSSLIHCEEETPVYKIYYYWNTKYLKTIITKFQHVMQYTDVDFVVEQESSAIAHQMASIRGAGVLSVSNLKEKWSHLAINLVKVKEPFLTYSNTNYYIYIHKNYKFLIRKLNFSLRQIQIDDLSNTMEILD